MTVKLCYFISLPKEYGRQALHLLCLTFILQTLKNRFLDFLRRGMAKESCSLLGVDDMFCVSELLQVSNCVFPLPSPPQMNRLLRKSAG